MGLTKGKAVLHMWWQLGVNSKTKSQTLAKTCFAPCQVMGQHGTCWMFIAKYAVSCKRTCLLLTCWQCC
jgi:hypothetical protein